MKRLIIATMAIMASVTTMFAEMEIVSGSFHNRDFKNREANASDIGQADLTAMSIDWPTTDRDGNDVNKIALIDVKLENFPATAAAEIKVQLGGGKFPISVQPKDLKGGSERHLWVFVPAGDFDVTLTHAEYGAARISGEKYLDHNIYNCILRNGGNTNVTIHSDPEGATVYVDGVRRGVTPLTLTAVAFGQHNITMSSPNNAIADGLKETTIDVSQSQTMFNFSLRKKRPVTFKAEPSDATIQLVRDGKVLTDDKGRAAGSELVFANLPYASYQIKGSLPGITYDGEDITIDGMTSPVYVVKVIGSRSINFRASQNNSEVRGADVTIDGNVVGKTPLTTTLTYGKHNVEMSYFGSAKKGKINVNASTATNYQKVLPAYKYHKRFNPFDVDWKLRDFGIAFNYVNKTYKLKADGESINIDQWGDEKTMNGVQVGLVYQPYFGYGQGLSTGIFWQAFFGSNDLYDDFSYSEHSIYVPVQYQFRLPIMENMSIFLNAGVGMSIGVSNSIKFDGNDETYSVGYGYNDEYDTYQPARFSCSALMGGGFQFKAMQIEAKYSLGLTDNPDMYINDGSFDKVSCKANSWSVGLSFLF